MQELSEQKTLNTDPRAIQQISFIGNVDREGNKTMFFVIEEAKETILDSSQGTREFCKYIFCFNVILNYSI